MHCESEYVVVDGYHIHTPHHTTPYAHTGSVHNVSLAPHLKPLIFYESKHKCLYWNKKIVEIFSNACHKKLRLFFVRNSKSAFWRTFRGRKKKKTTTNNWRTPKRFSAINFPKNKYHFITSHTHLLMLD